MDLIGPNFKKMKDIYILSHKDLKKEILRRIKNPVEILWCSFFQKIGMFFLVVKYFHTNAPS